MRKPYYGQSDLEGLKGVLRKKKPQRVSISHEYFNLIQVRGTVNVEGILANHYAVSQDRALELQLFEVRRQRVMMSGAHIPRYIFNLL
jgi:hypothetical protein